jgi:two-component system phosphate regulon sensor histidine kinase PhoR
MGRRRLLWKLIPSYLLISILVLAAVTLFALRSVRTFHFEQARDGLTVQAKLIENQVAGGFLSRSEPSLNQLCLDLGSLTGNRITIMDAVGRVMGDSHAKAATMDNHQTRPEVAAALAGTTGYSSRYSHTLRDTLLYVADPILDEGQVVGVLRTSASLAAIQAEQRSTLTRIIAVGLGMAVLAALFSFFVSRHLSYPLQSMTLAAQKFAHGDFGAQVPVPDSEELGQLADAMNRMSAQLNGTIQTIEEQRNELEAVLSSMAEGVLAVDLDERIINANEAIGQLLGVSPVGALNQTVQEVIRNPDIQAFIRRTLQSSEAQEAEITLLGSGGDLHLHAHGNLLVGPKERTLGALVVFHDVTRLKKLENMRRDFVANVSHELKTPITTIKGFVETLQDGAMNEPENAGRFLDIISRQSDRLTAIINDILSLSRLEQQGDPSGIEMQEGSVRDMLKSAVEACLLGIRKKNITIEIEADDLLRGVFKRDLLEQAIVNLIDNAVKYSEPGRAVRIKGWQEGKEVLIEVADQGRGIDQEHLPRLFERFYRVDKARSREMGGTGLGLAIVKHIAQVHGGTVQAKSQVGQGSTFLLRIPSDMSAPLS